MSPRKLTLTERVIERVKAMPQRHKTWFERLDADVKSELSDIKKSWVAGEIKSSALRLAEHISASLRESGISTVGHQGVINWLKKRD